MFNIIDEFFYNIEKKEKINNKNKVNFTKEEALDAFLSEIEHYLGDYAKERTVKSSEEILELCDEFENVLSDEDIFLYYRGFGNFLAGNDKFAFKDVKNAIDINGSAFEYYILIGKIYEKLKDETKAITSYMAALELNPKSLEALKKLGFIYMAILNLEQGIECFEKAYVIDQEDHEIYSGLAGCSFELGEIEKSLEYITKAIVLDGNNVNYYYNRAIINRVMGKYEDAIKDYKKTIELEPSYTIAYFYLADLYIQLKDIEEAKEILEQILIINDKYADAHMKLSYCYLLENNFEKALKAISNAIQLEKDNPEFYYKRAAIYVAIDDEELALNDYLELIEIDAKNPIIYDIIGKIYMEREEFEIGKEFFKKGLLIEKNESFYGNIAICDYHLKNLKEAKENFTNSINLSSQNIAEDYFFRGKCSYYLKEGDKGKVDFEMALSLDTEESMGALYYLAYICYTEGEFDKVIEYINDYFISEEDDYTMLRMLSVAYTEQENYIMAREVLLRAIEISDNKAEIYNDIGLSYYNQGNIHRAIQYYNKAIAQDNELYIAYNNRALAKEDQGHFLAAIKDYESANKIKGNPSYHFGIASCYEKLGKKEKSYKIYKDLAKKETSNAMIVCEIADAYAKEHDDEKAIEFYDIALEKEENYYTRLKKIEFLFKIEKYKEGLNEGLILLDLLEENPNDDVKYNLISAMADTYLEIKDMKNAIKAYEKCLDYKPLRNQSIGALIDIYKKERDKDKVNHYRKILKNSTI